VIPLLILIIKKIEKDDFILDISSKILIYNLFVDNISENNDKIIPIAIPKIPIKKQNKEKLNSFSYNK
jgi:uncharacterized membrane-anchored protein YitT (DUF2179 family)